MKRERIWCIVIYLCVEMTQILAEEIDEEDEEIKGLERLENWVLGRGKKKKQKYFIAFLMGIFLVKTIIVPIALKAMAIASGKAILLSALSLILASILGFKKTAEGWNRVDQNQNPYDRGDISYYPYPHELTNGHNTATWSREFKNS